MQHHGEFQPALPHPIVRAREELFLVRVHCCRDTGKAAQNPPFCQGQEKDGLSSARGAKNFDKEASGYCKAQLACKLEKQSLKASQLLTPLPVSLLKRQQPPKRPQVRGQALLANKCRLPQKKWLFQVMCPMLLPQGQT